MSSKDLFNEQKIHKTIRLNLYCDEIKDAIYENKDPHENKDVSKNKNASKKTMKNGLMSAFFLCLLKKKIS